MLQVASALKGYAIEATDGRIGTVSDFLFDDGSWTIRWLVVDTGGWLSARKVLIHPSAIGTADHETLELPVALTRAKVRDSPDIARDRPVSRQMESTLFEHYGWDPMWGGGSYFGGLSMGYPLGGYPLGATPYFGREPAHATAGMDGDADLAVNEGDPHLRSLAAIRGYQVHATDGDIGHVENFLIDDAAWGVRYLIIDTRNWWPGQHVLMSPYAVREISWAEHHVRLDVPRERVRTSPPWDPAQMIDEVGQKRVHTHYDWPGYGW